MFKRRLLTSTVTISHYTCPEVLKKRGKIKNEKYNPLGLGGHHLGSAWVFRSFSYRDY